MIATAFQPGLPPEVVQKIIVIIIYALISTSIYIFLEMLFTWIFKKTIMLFTGGEAFWVQITVGLGCCFIESQIPADILKSFSDSGPQFFFGNIVISSAILFFGIKVSGLFDTEVRKLSIINFLLICVTGIVAFINLELLEKLFF